MSGGHFDYSYFKVQQFAEQLEHDLQTAPWIKDFKPETVQELHAVLNEIRRTGRLMKEIEYLFSGDSSEEDFIAEVKAI